MNWPLVTLCVSIGIYSWSAHPGSEKVIWFKPSVWKQVFLIGVRLTVWSSLRCDRFVSLPGSRTFLGPNRPLSKRSPRCGCCLIFWSFARSQHRTQHMSFAVQVCRQERQNACLRAAKTRRPRWIESLISSTFSRACCSSPRGDMGFYSSGSNSNCLRLAHDALVLLPIKVPERRSQLRLEPGPGRYRDQYRRCRQRRGRSGQTDLLLALLFLRI